MAKARRTVVEADTTAGVARVLTFRSGADQIAVPADKVIEILRLPRLTRVPHAPESLSGVANLRGAVLPVISLEMLLGRKLTASPATARVLVLDHGVLVGVLVDEVLALTTAAAAAGAYRTLDIAALLQGSFAVSDRRAAAMVAPSAPKAAEVAEPVSELLTLVSFAVGLQTYALHLDKTREILAVPRDIVLVPNAADTGLGVISWRGRLLPLISSHRLLGLPQTDIDLRKSRIVVTESAGGTIGLVTDGMRENLRVAADAIDPVPAILTRGKEDTGIEGIARLDNGRRLVSILAAEKIFTSRQLTTEFQDEATMDSGESTAEGSQRFIVFDLGAERYGLPIEAVEEVVRLPETLTRIPRAPAFIEGAMNLRGKVVPIIDQAQRFGVAERSQLRGRRVIVIRLGAMQVGFVVDGVSEILSVAADKLSAAPDFAGDGTRIFDRVAHREGDGSILLLVDPQELLDRAEQDLLAALNNAATGPA